MPIQSYTGPFGREELKHLLRRTLFGATLEDLAFFEGQTLDQVIDVLLDVTNDTTPPIKAYSGGSLNNPDPDALDPQVAFGSTWVDTPRYGNTDDELTDLTGARIQSYMWWRTGLMVQQGRSIREKMVLFWFNQLPTQVFGIFNPRLSYEYDQLLRDGCLGNHRQLMYDVTISGSMLVFLNGYLNTAAAPDENYARELMELFTLGEGSGYTETDVQEAARVLTGWTVREQDIDGNIVLPFTFFRQNQHDQGDKQFSAFFNNTVISGVSGPEGGPAELNALLAMIYAKEEVSLFLCREIYRFFVHGEIDATTESEVIVPLAEIFRANEATPDQLRTVLRTLLTSAHFFSPEIRTCMIMSPADLVIGALRSLQMPFPTPQQFEAQYRVWRDVYWLTSYAGQELLNPPNVAGWPAYYQFPSYDEVWLDSATYPARKNSLLGIIYTGFSTGNNLFQPQSRNLEFKVDLLALVDQFTDPMDPNSLVADAADLLMAVPISEAVRNQLKTNFLLLGQQSDFYWSDAYELYVNDPNTTDMTAQLVPSILLWLFLDMAGAAETQLH
jgi:hypothetical protein